ncbi:MAG: folylpolyglutamate synthase/dihydrofolate synthase family protein [Verrucomicrobiota bacterium]
MTYSQAIQFLYDLRWFGAKLGLENTFKLAALAGNPQNQLRFIHVAGTNGKGSTCAMLESIYRAAGLRVGLFTSPHLVSFRERIQVNRQLISEADVMRLAAKLRERCSAGFQPAGYAGIPARSSETGGKDAARTRTQDACATFQPTFFEFITIMALCHFAEQKCDLVIWETGLGGRMDATNIVTPLASVITNIQLDHQQWLGNTIGQIAAEKAGIIKPGVPVLTAANEPEALEVIERTAREQNAPLFKVGQASRLSWAGGTPALPLLGEHQQLNAALAVATVGVLQNQVPVSEAAIGKGLSTVNWPGRLQLGTRPDGQKVLLDAAHNLAGAEILATALKKYFPTEPPTLVLGILRDKDWPAMCARLAPLAARIVTVAVGSERTATTVELAAACHAANPTAEVIECASFAEATKMIARDAFVVITGSLYLIGEALEWLGLYPEVGASERALNEWGGAKNDPINAPMR